MYVRRKRQPLDIHFIHIRKSRCKNKRNTRSFLTHKRGGIARSALHLRNFSAKGVYRGKCLNPFINKSRTREKNNAFCDVLRVEHKMERYADVNIRRAEFYLFIHLYIFYRGPFAFDSPRIVDGSINK